MCLHRLLRFTENARVQYGEDEKTDIAIRWLIIRAVAFAVQMVSYHLYGCGADPKNFKKSCSHGYTLNFKDPFLYKLVPFWANQMMMWPELLLSSIM